MDQKVKAAEAQEKEAAVAKNLAAGDYVADSSHKESMSPGSKGLVQQKRSLSNVGATAEQSSCSSVAKKKQFVEGSLKQYSMESNSSADRLKDIHEQPNSFPSQGFSSMIDSAPDLRRGRTVGLRETVQPGAVSVPGTMRVGNGDISDEDSDLGENSTDSFVIPTVSGVLVDQAANHASQVGELNRLRKSLAHAVEVPPRRNKSSDNSGAEIDEGIDKENVLRTWFRDHRRVVLLIGAALVASVVVAIVVPLTKHDSSKKGRPPLPISGDEQQSTEPTSSPFDKAAPPIPKSNAPAVSPMQRSSSSPTPPFEETCDMEVEIQCTYGNVDRFPGFDCSSFNPSSKLEPCNFTPFKAAFLLSGGDCSWSDNSEELDVQCVDHGTPPSTNWGEDWYFIIVTAALGIKDLYFRGWVLVGDVFTIASPDPFLLEDGFILQIYDSNETDTAANLLQEIVYEKSLCSSSLEHLARFGATQLLSYTNTLQGSVDPFAAFSLEMEATISIILKNRDSVNIALHSLEFSEESGVFLSTPEFVVEGLMLAPGTTMLLPFEIIGTLDMSEGATYAFYTRVLATSPAGSRCTGNFVSVLESSADEQNLP